MFNSPISNFNINFSFPKMVFRGNPVVYTPEIKGEPYSDGFTTNPLYEGIGSEQQILDAVKSNPRIKELLHKYNIPLKLNMTELEQLKRGHLRETRVVAAQMYSALPDNLKSEVNLKDLQDAAMFHDYGKVLIPASILNKAGSLTAEEREVMQLHTELGYELLKSSHLSENALNLIKGHHDYSSDIGAQILSIADKYGALKESRCYKGAMSREEALNIIYEDVKNGLIRQDVFDTLVKVV